NPGTPLTLIEYVLDLCDIVLIMTVNPGFGGQKFLPGMLPKIRALREMCNARGLNTIIEVDGGVGGPNAWQVLEAGANAIVAGSAVFNAPNYAKAITAIRNSTRPASNPRRTGQMAAARPRMDISADPEALAHRV